MSPSVGLVNWSVSRRSVCHFYKKKIDSIGAFVYLGVCHMIIDSYFHVCTKMSLSWEWHKKRYSPYYMAQSKKGAEQVGIIFDNKPSKARKKVLKDDQLEAVEGHNVNCHRDWDNCVAHNHFLYRWPVVHDLSQPKVSTEALKIMSLFLIHKYEI